MVTIKDVRDDLRDAQRLLDDGPVSWENCKKAVTYIVKAIGDLQDIEAIEEQAKAPVKLREV